MKIRAESFLGRVLAVFSRRSPGFRPDPQDIACTHEAPFKLAHGSALEVHIGEGVCRHEGQDVHAALKEALKCAGIWMDKQNTTVAAHTLDGSGVLVVESVVFVKDEREAS